MPELYLIDKAKLLSDIWDDLAFLEGAPVSARDAAKYLDNLVRKQPTIEAEPVRHGRWIVHTTWQGMFGLIHSECSECKFDRNGDLSSWKFCPNCGAKMDGGVDNG